MVAGGRYRVPPSATVEMSNAVPKVEHPETVARMTMLRH
jgi:hypothetical protein